MIDLGHKLTVHESEELRNQLEQFFSLCDYDLEYLIEDTDYFILLRDVRYNKIVIDSKNYFYCTDLNLLPVLLFNYLLYDYTSICWNLREREKGRAKIENRKFNGKWKPFEFKSYSEFAMQLALRCG